MFRLKELLLSLSIIAVTDQTYTRVGYFTPMANIRMAHKFFITQLSQIPMTRCIQRCMQHYQCLTFAYGYRTCLLYSSDPRTELEEPSLMRKFKIHLNFFTFHRTDQRLCYVNKIPVNSGHDIQKCAIGGKIQASKCSEWGDWQSIYGGAKDERFVGKINITKSLERFLNCTRPLNNGVQCVGKRYERKEKFVHLIRKAVLEKKANEFCRSNGLELFTGLYMIPEGSWPGGDHNYWTGFIKLYGKIMDRDAKQWVTYDCPDMWGHNQPDAVFGPEPYVYVTDGRLTDRAGMLIAYVACDRWEWVQHFDCDKPYFSLI